MNTQSVTTQMDVFQKNALGLMFSVMLFTLMIIITAIVITTGKETATCVTFAFISALSLIASVYFTNRIGNSN